MLKATGSLSEPGPERRPGPDRDLPRLRRPPSRAQPGPRGLRGLRCLGRVLPVPTGGQDRQLMCGLAFKFKFNFLLFATHRSGAT